MKKNWTMRVGALMLVLTLITSCFVGGTFAKYVTSGNSTDSARVAKFGVVVTGTDETFHKTYAAHDAKYIANKVSANTVYSTEKVVAPGTSGNMQAFSITGKPEVAVRVAFTVPKDGIKLENWRIPAPTADDANATKYYCPIVVTVGDTDLYGMNYSSEKNFAAAIKDAIEAYTNDYKPNTDLASATVKADAPSISWAWAFDATSTVEHSKNTDVEDTALGNWELNGLAAPTITIGVEATVTQID